MYTFQSGELERPSVCSVCGGKLEPDALTEVRDSTFFNVSGTWTFSACAHCGSLQLTPRPSAASIHHAYASYYTHEGASETPAATGARERLVESWASSELRTARLGKAASLALRMVLLAGDFRTLESARPPRRVLDVGCGSGAFLERARRMGHHVMGIDNDRQAVSNARRRGLACELGTIAELLPEHAGSFDLLTASHVIEHVHEPRDFLLHCHSLLAPGGTLWLETPNAKALGLKLYGRDWRGLEAPRHLCLFSEPALTALMHDVGFMDRQLHWTGLVSPYTFSRSLHARTGERPDSPMRIRPAVIAAAVALDLTRAALGRKRQEFITMTAVKPAAA